MDLAAKGSGCGSVADTGRDICGVVTGTVRASDHRMGGTASSESVTRHVADTSLKGWQAVVSLGYLQARTKSTEVKVTSFQPKDRQAKHVVREDPPPSEHSSHTP